MKTSLLFVLLVLGSLAPLFGADLLDGNTKAWQSADGKAKLEAARQILEGNPKQGWTPEKLVECLEFRFQANQRSGTTQTSVRSSAVACLLF